MTYQPRVTRTIGNTEYGVTSDIDSNALLSVMVDEIRGLRDDLAQQDGVSIVDGCGTHRRATVSTTGALSVGPIRYDETSSNTMAVDDQAYNFFSPSPGEQFVLTGIMAFAQRGVSDSSDTIITIYEADSTVSTTVDETLILFGMGRLTVLPLVPLNILANPGTYINAKTDDNTINMTIMGYFVNTEV